MTNAPYPSGLDQQTEVLIAEVTPVKENTESVLSSIADNVGMEINDNVRNFIDETAKIESGIYDNPLTVVNPVTQATGMYQFVETEENNSVETGLNRLSAKKKDGSYVYFDELPEWVEEAKKHKDVTKLDEDQQTALFLANLHQQEGTNDLFKKISEGDMQAKVDMYMRHHYKNIKGKYAADVSLHAEKIFFGLS